MPSFTSARQPLLITRSGRASAAVLSFAGYNSLEGAAVLLRNTKDAKRLIESGASLKRVQGTERELIA
ncbi:MAG TPA: type II toxin-antitoxin system Phd/YefM family antitoxin [Thermoanaerobaculia bacterium]|nr:type II toxin-antitoxin system Phd/YefM family antitoxin [Thermoanaerobaculia bacterium]